MFKEEYHLAIRFKNCDETLAFTINTKTAIIRYWSSKALQLMVTYQDNRAHSKYLDLSQYAPGYTVDITKEFISDILECAESLPIRPVYIPPHFNRDTWIVGTLEGALVNPFPFEYITRRLNDLPVRVVVCAANRVHNTNLPNGSIIIPGPRHHSSIMNALYDALEARNRITRTDRDEQGFIDQWGQFMDRKEALKVVMSSGQPFDVERNGCGNPPNELYSEGIC